MVERRTTYIAPHNLKKVKGTIQVSPPPGEKPKAEGAAQADNGLCRIIALRVRT